ncbi:MAG: TlyA family RNA methyltransferase [Desulfocapsa sp.]|uniref:TlyA family RNA methyltransferase n=1 Tax=Desulfotalea psychrophila TaxID=84980 RepID=A0ABS3AT53_9BACT|nr:TlyA family RNA methyltransferase [Desulfocapsa sp.]MBN4046014.1 TlyA family RNA methyltransferase [bacterium AH-315-P11]MBN4067951.1 TlyA family RNA methyltransferase [Desulfotalea psychrophila]
MAKIRLDELLVCSGLSTDLQQARRIIGAGEVTIDGHCVDKAGTLFPEKSIPVVKSKCPYVSRGGYKLKGGLEKFGFNPTGMICVDVGASSGGFTDCLLQHGARKVYAVDVAYGMLDWKLRQDSRVVVIERFNARNISAKQIPEPIDLAVIDAAFISLTKLIPPLVPLFGKNLSIICLIKPQFELPPNRIPKGGVVKNTEHHQQAIDKIITFITSSGLNAEGLEPSPILGPKGNCEFLLKITR